MTKELTSTEIALLKAEVELKLYINENLYTKKYISEEMFEKAKDIILKDQNRYEMINL